MTDVEPAMVNDITAAYQLIARNAASGKDLDQFLRMMLDAHEMMQDSKECGKMSVGVPPPHATYTPPRG